MSASILWLHEVSKRDAALVGGKAANLGELAGAGFPVPPGFVVSSAVYAALVEGLDLAAEFRALRDGPREENAAYGAWIRGLIEGAVLGPEIEDAILSAHRRLLAERGSAVLVAVRSSATAEDLGALSFAGQHGTYYYVDAAQLLKRVKQCWASLWSPEAVFYRASHGVDHASVSMAVMVQEMIASEVSGVTFTANPVSGARDEVIIESSWGMGAAIVDGRVTPDRTVLARDGLRVRAQRVADKRFMVSARLEPGREARLEEVPHELRRRETLAPELLREVASWSLRAEAHFGGAQDVEWAWSGGRFYLLQSRPITAIGREEIGKGVLGRWLLFKPLAENFTDPVTPLTEDLLFLISPPSLRSIRGWMYVDLRHLRALLPFEASDAELAAWLYSFSAAAPRWPLSLRRLPLALFLYAFSYSFFAVSLARTRALPDQALAGFRALCRKVDEDPALGPEAALRRLFLVPSLFDPIGNMAIFVNILSLRFAPWMALLRRLLRRWAPVVRPDAEVLLGSGSEGVLSAEMGRAIGELGRQARQEPRVREILTLHPPERALAELRQEPQAREFLAHLDAFLATNGHRALKEFELRSVRWEENPAPVLGMIRNYVLIGTDAAPEAKAAEARADLIAEVRRTLDPLPFERAFGLRFRLLELAAARVRYYLKLRENSRFYHIMGFGILRRKVVRIEAELIRRGKLRCRDDIFFLLLDEVAGLESDRLGWLDVEDRIRERRIAHIRLSKMSPPKTIGFELPRSQPVAEHDGEATLLQGESASPGRYEGTARVILDPSTDAELRPGEVLVAPYTDPAWTPLFLTAGASVVEIGSYLSHAGTVAREFGMPCVVDVAEATQRIRTGDRVAVDGDAGSVRILARKERS